MMVVSPFTGDWSWDWFDALFMSVLTFLSAPWALGVLVRGVQAKSTSRQIYVALCLWLFSASWSYDGYILIRDGYILEPGKRT